MIGRLTQKNEEIVDITSNQFSSPLLVKNILEVAMPQVRQSAGTRLDIPLMASHWD